jgi:hypothetical protein
MFVLESQIPETELLTEAILAIGTFATSLYLMIADKYGVG